MEMLEEDSIAAAAAAAAAAAGAPLEPEVTADLGSSSKAARIQVIVNPPASDLLDGDGAGGSSLVSAASAQLRTSHEQQVRICMRLGHFSQ